MHSSQRTLEGQLHRNTKFSFSDTHHNYSQEINSAVPCGAQFYYIRLAPHAASPDILSCESEV
jgi:hypothetical protein